MNVAEGCTRTSHCSEIEAGHGITRTSTGEDAIRISGCVGVKRESTALVSAQVDSGAGHVILKAALDRVPAKHAGKYIVERVGSTGGYRGRGIWRSAVA